MPDMLVMTATPIPRTLAMTVYGDLEVSYLDELPAGRQPVTTRVLADRDRKEAYAVARDGVAKGHQAFIVFPLVEDSEATPLRAATAMVADLRAATFAGHSVGLVHGRMRSEEKDETMRRFKAGDYRVLVCTTVIEVGIDIPNATIMVIEHADRFGLAQLHQLRGRVGRGGAAGACFLIASRTCPGGGYERLKVMEETHDGLEIAEADLRIRGPGEFLGTRQAGLPELRVASLLRDTELLEVAREETKRALGANTDLDASGPAWRRVVSRHPWADQLSLL
jgi:ATP-dependent DNA helicase RecG